FPPFENREGQVPFWGPITKDDAARLRGLALPVWVGHSCPTKLCAIGGSISPKERKSRGGPIFRVRCERACPERSRRVETTVAGTRFFGKHVLVLRHEKPHFSQKTREMGHPSVWESGRSGPPAFHIENRLSRPMSTDSVLAVDSLLVPPSHTRRSLQCGATGKS